MMVAHLLNTCYPLYTLTPSVIFLRKCHLGVACNSRRLTAYTLRREANKKARTPRRPSSGREADKKVRTTREFCVILSKRGARVEVLRRRENAWRFERSKTARRSRSGIHDGVRLACRGKVPFPLAFLAFQRPNKILRLLA